MNGAAATSPAVTTNGLTRRFGAVVAVDSVSLTIATGEIFGLLGPNGAGKTTLIRMLCGIQRPSSGTATVLGFDAVTEAQRIQEHIGYVSQAFSLYGDLTVDENLSFYAGIYGHVSKRRVGDVCDVLGLDGDDRATRVDRLGTGVRQRAALAAAVLHAPPLLFLDEPTSGVDPLGRREFWELIRAMAVAGTTVVVSTHVMAEAERCDRIALLDEGRILTLGSPKDVRAASGLSIARVDARPWQSAYRTLKERWPDATLHGTATHVPQAGGRDLGADIRSQLAELQIVDVETLPPTLDDAFVWFIRNGDHDAPAPIGA